VGNRGAMAGIGVSIGIAISYWGIGLAVREDRGCEPVAAGYRGMVADALFSLTGLYLLLRMRS
jgi:hypothetical protein